MGCEDPLTPVNTMIGTGIHRQDLVWIGSSKSRYKGLPRNLKKMSKIVRDA